jgi:hypothetical protein
VAVITRVTEWDAAPDTTTERHALPLKCARRKHGTRATEM